MVASVRGQETNSSGACPKPAATMLKCVVATFYICIANAFTVHNFMLIPLKY